ncbi:kinase-like domain-containing protein [Leptodontidium sp. MPI-SDFR-AT-0119]|nr:kinase-like domain-containing protein [Leptodontidium sp. MPI-SDFR-AT-0119]
MAGRLERSNSTATQFPGPVSFEKQEDLESHAITPPKRNQHDDHQRPQSRKRTHREVQSDSDTANNDDSKFIDDMRSHRLPPKLSPIDSLFVPQEIRSVEEPSPDLLPLRRASPWHYYTKVYRRELGGPVVVASKVPATFELFAVKCAAGSKVNDQAQTLRQIRHENFLTCIEIFAYEGAVFTVSEYMAISLTDLNGSAVPPNEIQVATIAHEVLTGLNFLASRDMMHGDITCSTILLSLRGDVKIANPEGCFNIDLRSHGLRKDTEALGLVMLQLMERGSYPPGRVALKHPDRWSQQADEFLHLTASSSVKELLLASYLNPHFLFVLIVLACFLKELTTKGGACEPGWLRSDILVYPILS